MNKKVLGLLAGTAAVVGSVISAAPVRAQSAILPVELEVTPAIFLRTYSGLKFIVSEQDLQGGNSVDQIAGVYDETGTITPLSTDPPSQNANTQVVKTVPMLYQIWGGSQSPQIEVTPTQTQLTTQTGGGIGTSTTVTMGVSGGTLEQSTDGNYKKASADFTFDFPSSTIGSGTTFTGGEVTIRIVTP
ncbi:MAG: hypothetical protein AAFQ91_03420 [Cyanobacteria bacterium J06621_15]